MLISCGPGSNAGKLNQVSSIGNNVNEQAEVNNQIGSTTEKINSENKPVDVALTFINSYAENCNKLKEAIGIIDWVNSNELSTNSFKKEVKRIIEEARESDPELGLGFDPIFDAQDFDNQFELENFDSKTNFVVVKGKSWKDFKLTIKVVLEDNRWLVDGCGIISIPEAKRSKR